MWQQTFIILGPQTFSSIYKPYILLKPCIHNSIGVYTFYMVSNLCSFQFSIISYIAYLWHTLIAMCSTPGHDSQLILIVSCDLCMMYLLDEALELNVNRRMCNVDKLKKNYRQSICNNRSLPAKPHYHASSYT